MPLRKQHPVRFTPKGLSDAFDATEAFPGACRSLQNLVFDPSNPELVVCRPGGVALTSFASFTSPTFLSVYISIGVMVYGMVSTARNPGQDEPFAFNTSTGVFIAISGVTSGNTPTSPPTSGLWVPPTMAVVGTTILVTHPGFSGTGSNYFGAIDISTPTTPAWSAANLATSTLPSVPTAVANFNNRAYYACGNVAYFSDVLVPLTRTNASQSLTIGDPSPIQAFSGLPVQTTSGGVTSAMMVFKQFQVWQVTGDSALTTLALNYLSLNVGTISPRSVIQTPYGTYFAAIDGPYYIDPLGAVKPLTRDLKVSEQDIQAPFIYSRNPSRVAAGYSGGVYRICMDTIVSGQNITGDYWFDIQRRRWNGPHTLNVDCMAQIGNYFVISHANMGAVLLKSELTASATSVYTDNGAAISCVMESCTMPKDGNMAEKQIVESTLELSTSGSRSVYQITALDDQRNPMDSTTITVNTPNSLWGAFVWGVGSWSSSLNIPTVYTINWNVPLVFQKMALLINVTGQNNLTIGTFFARYQETGYTNMRV